MGEENLNRAVHSLPGTIIGTGPLLSDSQRRLGKLRNMPKTVREKEATSFVVAFVSCLIRRFETILYSRAAGGVLVQILT